ncbi:MAG: ribonuclease H-like domain-containing protein [bacterium]
MSATTLGEGIRALARRRAERAGASAPWIPSIPARPQPLDASELEGAETIEVEGQPVLSIRRSVEELVPGIDVAEEIARALDALAASDPAETDRGLAPARGMRLADVAVLDLETTGFWGCPVLLAGILQLEGDRLVARQLVARDYPEERPLLAAALAHLAERRLLVTFNGKSYDLPCLRERCVVLRVRDDVTRRLSHVDVLHPARRRWRGRFEDCRLATLERRVIGLSRAGDVPSRDIPELFHRFVATGDASLLRPVLHHGRVDLLTTARLFAALGSARPA